MVQSIKCRSKVLDKLSCKLNVFEWLFQRAANPGWSGIGLENPGTSVANIACIESGALYPRIWYHKIKNLQIYCNLQNINLKYFN